ncbi:MAG: TIM barrel protein [Actinophytocola sp.]|nr:TIM barrel protein [Actinophytocola sp.]
MRKSIATVSVSGTLQEKLVAVAEAGFDGVELFENDLITTALSPAQVRRQAADLGLTIDLYQPFRDLDSSSGERFRANLRRAERKFALMHELGVDTMLVCSNVSDDAVADDTLLAEQLHTAAEAAAAHGIVLAYEALAWGRYVDDYRHAWRIVERVDHPALGTCLDSFHILSRGSDPAGIRKIPGAKIAFVQLADAPLLAMDVLQWSRHYRCFPGQGGFDVVSLTEHVLATGYDGPLSLEVFNDVFRKSDNRRTARDAMRSLIALEGDTARMATGEPLATPQHAPTPTGFAFAELAAPPDSGVADLLRSLGFRHTGRHRTKPVQLWQQGDARVLVNAGGATPQLSAIGLESPDPERAAGRAEDLLSPVLPREWAPDEAKLDAVAAPDGTALFFCRTGHDDHVDWQQDFLPVAGTTEREAGVTRIDHVALSQPWNQFDEATLFYRSVLGLQPHDIVELPDPYGLLRSRAISGPGDAVRIALNVAEVRDEEHITEPPTQHVALGCDDLIATARRLHANGVPILAVPDNYYADLEARFELAPELLADLRELGLLYDRDERGEYLHLYTKTVGQVFFEIVQRVDHYAGYGAHNAPVRLTVQHAGGH